MSLQLIWMTLVLAWGVPAAAVGQFRPVGPEFQVNTYTVGDQGFPHIASDAAGNFVVVWSSSGQDGSTFGLFGQRYGRNGVKLGVEFQVNTLHRRLSGNLPAWNRDECSRRLCGGLG